MAFEGIKRKSDCELETEKQFEVERLEIKSTRRFQLVSGTSLLLHFHQTICIENIQFKTVSIFSCQSQTE